MSYSRNYVIERQNRVCGVVIACKIRAQNSSEKAKNCHKIEGRLLNTPLGEGGERDGYELYAA